MASVPNIQLRDGSGFVTSLIFSTNMEAVSLQGTVDVNTSAVQVSLNGGDYVSDPNLVDRSRQTFTIPNLAAYPSGLPLDLGVNTILVRSIDIVGGVSAPASIIVTRLSDIDAVGVDIPTGIRVERLRDTVQILVANPKPLTNIVLDDQGEPVVVTVTTATFLGFNFYASTQPAGATGYFKVNEKPVLQPTAFEEELNLSYSDLAVWDVSAAKTIRVRITEENEFGEETAIRLDAIHRNTILSGRLRFTGALDNYELNEFTVFMHDRKGGTGLINSDQFTGVAASDPLYYVVTGVYYDPGTSSEIESAYSQEVLATPLVIDTTVRDLPGRTQNQIVADYINQVLRANSEISLVPGSVLRDVSIDPFSSEAERIWFLLDFVHRCQSFLTLMAIDNVSGDGNSDPVATSAYKQALKAALGLQSDSAVQSLIDQQFDKLAANVGKSRLAGRSAVGTLTLYTSTRPALDLTVPAGSYAVSTGDASSGISSQRFRIGGSYVLPAANADAFYNFNAKRYELRVAIVAELAGSAGNVPAGAIKSLVGISGLLAINESATVFGDDQETNADLAVRALTGFSSVDTGTENGYASTAAAKIGVIRSKIVKSGDPLMMRDYDEVRGKHIGGKVDVWIQGLLERQVQDRFAFVFDEASNIQAQVVDATNLIFRVLDSRVTPNTPIISVASVWNATVGQAYDLGGLTLLDYQRIQLGTLNQPVTNVDDVIMVSYRFQTANQLVMTVQPVRSVVSVIGEVSGALTEGIHYKLYKTDDPLLDGESTLAKDYVAVTPANGLPRRETIVVNNESHVLIGFEQEPLDSIGINTALIRVFDLTRSTEYDGPGSASPDFNIVSGTLTTPAKLVRTSGSSIANGEEVVVDYSHDENFTVTYRVNDLLQQLQSIMDAKRHVTADVLVKQAIQNEIDLETTVQLNHGATKDNTDPQVRTNVSLNVNKKGIGEGAAQSNIDAAINDTPGVNYNVLPMARMSYADGSQKLREPVLSTCVRVPAYDGAGDVQAFLLTTPLALPTTDGGGLDTEHTGVFQDDVGLILVSAIKFVGTAPKQAYIIGSEGVPLVISGYTDDATLAAAGIASNEYASERLNRTANRVILSLRVSGTPLDDPSKHQYAVSYVVRGDSGSHDIEVADIEVLDLGKFTITWKEAQA